MQCQLPAGNLTDYTLCIFKTGRQQMLPAGCHFVFILAERKPYFT